MKINGLNGMSAILLLMVLVSPLYIAAAEPLEPHPDWEHWPAGTLWGAELSLENAYADVYFGAKTGAEHVYLLPPAPVPPWIKVALVQGGTDYAEITRTADSSYTWYVMFQSSAAQTGLTISAELENATHWFVPHDHSVILENQAQGIGPFNLRVENGSINLSAWVPKYATLYVDNHVNLTIENLDPLVGNVGDPLSLKVTVYNIGRYSDNFDVGYQVGGSVDPHVTTFSNLGPGDNDNVTIPIPGGIPAGTENIIVWADGWYADDNDYVTATGLLVRMVEVKIRPEENFGENGEIVTFDVCVKNTSAFSDNYELTVDNVWAAWVSPTQLENLDPGENKHATLSVKIPPDAKRGDSDNVTVTAASKENENVSDNATCIARVGFYGIKVSILENYQENAPGGKLNYTVRISNTGTIDDNYKLTFMDNIDGSDYWEENISLDNDLLEVSSGDNATTTLRVIIPDNAPPSTLDNITVTATSQADNTIENSASFIAHVAIVRGVQITITPESQTAGPRNWLEYTVHVVNTCSVADTYSLTVSDDSRWDDIRLDDETLWVDKGDNENTTLYVHIPWDTMGDTEDIIIVTATSQADPSVFAWNTCTVFVAWVEGVEVSISPSYQENLPGENLIFGITVRNTGNIASTYELENRDNVGWTLSLENTSLAIPPFEERTTKLTVTIPENALPYTKDSIRVIATSQENESVRAEDSCIAHATIVRRVDVSISPSYDNGLPGENVSFTVKVTNAGTVWDNYALEVDDNQGWSLDLADNLFENVAPGENRSTALTVTIPENAPSGTKDNITITAISQTDNTVSDRTSCIVHSLAIIRGVGVSILPNEKEGMLGIGLSYTIVVTNTGKVTDSYDLTVLDNLGWSLSLTDNSLENVTPDENRTTTLTVVIHENAEPNTEDNITVTATSWEDPAVSDSASCLARALILRQVEITISPGYRSGPSGATLNYTVKVTNTSWAADNYRLVSSGTAGWLASIDPDSLALEPGESGEAVLSVTVPPDVGGSSMIFYVWAILSVDPTVRSNATCRALALEIGIEGKLLIPWAQIIIIAALIAGAVFAVGYLTRRRGRGRRYSVLKEVST